MKIITYVQDDWAEIYGLPYDVNPTHTTSRQELGEPALTSLLDIIVRGRKIIDVPTKDPLKVNLIHPILEVDLPYLEGDKLSIADYCAITVHETRAFAAVRDHLRAMFLKLDQTAAESEQFDRDILLIGIELRQQIREYEAELDRIKQRRAVARTGAGVASIPAMLVAIWWHDLAPALAALGLGGGGKLLYDSKMKEIDTRPSSAEFPCLYLWLLQERANRSPGRHPRHR